MPEWKIGDLIATSCPRTGFLFIVCALEEADDDWDSRFTTIARCLEGSGLGARALDLSEKRARGFQLDEYYNIHRWADRTGVKVDPRPRGCVRLDVSPALAAPAAPEASASTGQG